eukprot:m.229267 g.229267  ORF g.229267 m.229267 type:complete len:336 (-) comp17712_c0_seq1:24-1031(-)
MVVVLALKLALAVLLLYLLFWAVWLFLHKDALYYRRFSKDKKWKKIDENHSAFSASATGVRRKRVVFVRHGESLWNFNFNRSKLPHKMIPRLLKSAVDELKLIFKGSNDSLFYDSPLSDLGAEQALNLRTFLQKHPASAGSTASILRGDESKVSCVIVASNLRRAISTALHAFWDRLHTKEERVLVLPCLQEITVNPDALAISPPFSGPVLSELEPRRSDGTNIERGYRAMVDMSQHTGNKTVDSTGLDRMLQFNEWLFGANTADMVVAVGHSLWFKSYFNEFLPSAVTHELKTNKLPNCGMVEFEIECATVVNQVTQSSCAYYRVDPVSIKLFK